MSLSRSTNDVPPSGRGQTAPPSEYQASGTTSVLHVPPKPVQTGGGPESVPPASPPSMGIPASPPPSGPPSASPASHPPSGLRPASAPPSAMPASPLGPASRCSWIGRKQQAARAPSSATARSLGTVRRVGIIAPRSHSIRSSPKEFARGSTKGGIQRHRRDRRGKKWSSHGQWGPRGAGVVAEVDAGAGLAQSAGVAVRGEDVAGADGIDNHVTEGSRAACAGDRRPEPTGARTLL
jgi:hypothetical protein